MKLLALLLVLAACPKGKSDKVGEPVEPIGKGDAQQSRLLPEDDGGVPVLAPAPPLPGVPAGLPALTVSPRVTPDALALGELLFYEPRLAQSGSRACASCHDPAAGYSGDVANAADGKANLRRTPALVNLAWAKTFGWDGRYASFAEHLPAHIKGQLGDALDAVVPRLEAVPLYRAHFARIGGTTVDAITQALEAYVLTRYEGDSAWDRMERTVLTKSGTTSSDPIVAGYQLFVGKAQCGVCHVPPLYSDGGFHTVAANPHNDPGKSGAFKTPTLRGAAKRVSYFHAGTARTLDEVIKHYIAQANAAGVDPAVAKIKLTADEAKQVVAFLKTLTSDRTPPEIPVLP